MRAPLLKIALAFALAALLMPLTACTSGEIFELPAECDGIKGDLYTLFVTAGPRDAEFLLLLEEAEFLDCDLSNARWPWA